MIALISTVALAEFVVPAVFGKMSLFMANVALIPKFKHFLRFAVLGFALTFAELNLQLLSFELFAIEPFLNASLTVPQLWRPTQHLHTQQSSMSWRFLILF
jgi:hypothetical protein